MALTKKFVDRVARPALSGGQVRGMMSFIHD
jgi:hypothetical protein